MSETTRQRVWHPVPGVVLVTVLAIAGCVTGVTTFLAMGAVAGFAVSGST